MTDRNHAWTAGLGKLGGLGKRSGLGGLGGLGEFGRLGRIGGTPPEALVEPFPGIYKRIYTGGGSRWSCFTSYCQGVTAAAASRAIAKLSRAALKEKDA